MQPVSGRFFLRGFRMCSCYHMWYQLKKIRCSPGEDSDPIFHLYTTLDRENWIYLFVPLTHQDIDVKEASVQQGILHKFKWERLITGSIILFRKKFFEYALEEELKNSNQFPYWNQQTHYSDHHHWPFPFHFCFVQHLLVSQPAHAQNSRAQMKIIY